MYFLVASQCYDYNPANFQNSAVLVWAHLYCDEDDPNMLCRFSLKLFCLFNRPRIFEALVYLQLAGT